MQAVRLVQSGLSTREVARHLGYSQGAIVKWTQRSRDIPRNAHQIPTRSSRPKSHPKALEHEMIDAILRYRMEYRRCAEVIHFLLKKDGHTVSLSSVKRVLKRYHLTYPSPWKKWHVYPPRPVPEKPGILVEIDTVHDGRADENRLYIYTLLDVYSRWAYAWPTLHINTHASLRFLLAARQSAPFVFATIQSDHGPEFSKWFTKLLDERDLHHRHSRVRTPNDNAHLERFNRTIQEECLARCPRSLGHWRRAIPEYLRYYNHERPHMGLNFKSPMDMMPK